MDHQLLNLDQLSVRLGRDRREVERLVQRGNLPGRKVNDQWQFHPAEITQWLEQEIRGYNAAELVQIEGAQRSTELDPQLPVMSLLKPELVQVPLEARTKRSVLESLLEVAGRTWHVWEPAAILQAMLDREAACSTGFENGVAIPHIRTPMPDSLGEPLIAYGRTFSGIPFGAPKRALTDIYFLVLCRDSRTHLQVLARLGRMIQVPNFLDDLRAADDPQASFDIIAAADQKLG